MENKKLNYSVKCTIVGDCNIGKTSIINKFINQKQNINNATIGAIYWSFERTINNTLIKMNMWDTAGQEKYHSLIPMYTRSCDILLLTFDLSDKKTFYNLKKWYNLANNVLNIKYIIIGNKNDKTHLIQVTPKMIKEFILNNFNEEQEVKYILTSAKTGENIKELFDLIFNISEEIYIKKKIFTKEVNYISLNEENIDKRNCCY